MPPRGRGRGNGGNQPAKKQSDIVAKPSVSKIPTNLQIEPSGSPIPAAIRSTFTEFSKMQPFFSGLEKLQPELETSIDAYTRCWLGIPDEKIKEIRRTDDNTFLASLILTDDTENKLFVKRIHLLEPVAAMEGEYLWPEDGALPAPSELFKNALEKINHPYNEAYVDCIFAMYASKLVENGYSPGWCKCYGTFAARAEKYLYNISDEISSMRNKPWWNKNRRLGLFSLYNEEEREESEEQSKFFNEGLAEIDTDDFIEITNDVEPKTTETETEAEKEKEKEKDDILEETPEMEDSPVKLTSPKLRLRRLTRSVGSDSSDSSCSESHQFAEFRNFPVQVTLLERADGTMDALIDDEDEDDLHMASTKEARWTSWLFQVVAALSVAQYYFGFVHNDLHTNNVMWNETSEEYIYYRLHKGKETTYKKVPTFGKIMKIIDFGRSSFTLPDPAGFLISDAFFPGNDAGDQYNCDPFFDPKEGKKLEPNPSFDLCRLSVSLIESLFQDRPDPKQPISIMTREDGGKKLYTETVSGVYNLLWSWLQDDTGNNVLRNPDGTERYPDFDLYKAIASDVHKAVPKMQIEKPIFHSYSCVAKDIPKGKQIYDLYA